jgi:hypothetical protein
MRLRFAPLHPVAVLGMAFLASMCMSGEIPDDGAHWKGGDAAPLEIGCESASDCPIPPSTCDVDGLVYYTNPYCASGSCVWVRKTLGCGCSDGGCYSGAGGSTTGGLPNLTQDVCVPPACSGCANCLQDCECRSRDAGACAAQCSEAGMAGSPADGALDAAGDSIECNDVDLSACRPPPSHCIDAQTLGYFVNVSCVDYRCAWEQKSIACPCVGGACQSTTTAGGTWSDSG